MYHGCHTLGVFRITHSFNYIKILRQSKLVSFFISQDGSKFGMFDIFSNNKFFILRIFLSIEIFFSNIT